MSRPTRPTARVTRLTPASSTLRRASGQRIALGAQVADGERVTMLTPTGTGGTVTLDAAGVGLRVTMGRLPVEVEAPPPVASVYESGPRVSADPVLPMAGSVGVRALATPEKAPAVKVVVASAAGPASIEEVEAVRDALDNGEEEGK